MTKNWAIIERMRRWAVRGVVCAVLCALPGSSAAAPDGDALMARLEGVYKRRFRIEVVGDGAVMVEDVVEIVRHAPGQIYVRAALNFANGHSCGIYGIAVFERDAFVYRTTELAEKNAPCILSVAERGVDLMLSDRPTPESGATCAAYCGARGSLSEYRIPMKNRRPIRYLARLKASRQYKEAVAGLGAASSPASSAPSPSR